MTADEIVALYRGSSDKNQQLKNLVDLAQLPLSEIVGILTAAGCKVEPGWKEMMPVTYVRFYHCKYKIPLYLMELS